MKHTIGFFSIFAFVVLFGLAAFFSLDEPQGFALLVSPKFPNSILISGLDLNEYLGNDYPSLSEKHLAGLADGEVRTKVGRTKYRQSLRLRDTNSGGFDGGRLVFAESEKREVDNFIEFRDVVFEYEISFSPGLRSKIVDDELVSLEDKEIALLGNSFSFFDGAIADKSITLTLVGGFGNIELEDNNFEDTAFTPRGASVNKLKVNADVKITAQKQGNELVISGITYRLNAQPPKGSIVYLPRNRGVKEFLRYPEGLLVPEFDVVYGGLQGSKKAKITSERPSGGNLIALKPTSNGYNLLFANQLGQFYKVKVLENDGGIKYSDSGSLFHFNEGSGFFIAKGDAFLVTSQNTINGISNILEYNSIDTSSRTVYFTDLAGGSSTAVYDTAGNGVFTHNGVQYDVQVDTSAPNSISVDLNNDGTLNSGEAKIIIAGGGMLDFDAVSGSSAEIDLTTVSRLFEERTTDETITFTVSESGSGLDVSVSGVTLKKRSDFISTGLTNYGAFVSTDDGKAHSSVEVDYPGTSRSRKSVSSGSGQQQGLVLVTLERAKWIQKQE